MADNVILNQTTQDITISQDQKIVIVTQTQGPPGRDGSSIATQVSGSQPPTGTLGQFWIHETTDVLRYYDGSEWTTTTQDDGNF